MNPLRWWKKYKTTRQRILIEDALKHMHAFEWDGRAATMESLAGAIGLSPRSTLKLSALMQSQGLVQLAEGGLQMTPAGREIALEVIRAHRLWERFLADEARMPLARIHAEADRLEHKRAEETITAMDAAMGHPSTDPHGDPIPTQEGELQKTHSVPLSEWHENEPAIIVHLEDEPTVIFDQIAALDLYPGQRIRVIESNDQRIVFTDELQTHILSPVVSGNIFVTKAAQLTVEADIERLSSLQPGSSAEVLKLDDNLRGFTRRRLLDLGLTPGAGITTEYSSMMGDPTAYRVRGSLIALRKHQAKHVLIKTMENGHE